MSCDSLLGHRLESISVFVGRKEKREGGRWEGNMRWKSKGIAGRGICTTVSGPNKAVMDNIKKSPYIIKSCFHSVIIAQI